MNKIGENNQKLLLVDLGVDKMQGKKRSEHMSLVNPENVKFIKVFVNP